MEDAESTWSALLSRLPQVREFVDDCDGLAARVAGLAEGLDRFVEANAATLIHGDCKAWNLFFGEDRALFIDLQWVGRGHPMQVSLGCLFDTVSTRSIFYKRHWKILTSVVS